MTQPTPDGDVDSVDVGYANAYSPLEQSEILDSDDLGSTDHGYDPLDDGWDPPDRLSPVERFGTTPAEQHTGESLDSLLAQEQPEPDPYAEAARLEAGEVLDSDVYATVVLQDELSFDLEDDNRSPTLLADDEGVRNVTTSELVARISGTGRRGDRETRPGHTSAEEDAIHIRNME